MDKIQNILLLFVLALCSVPAAKADLKDIVIMDGNKGFSTQTYFSTGRDNPFPKEKIKKYWDEGKRITSLSHGASGWCVAVSGNSGIQRQLYFYQYKWPKDEISKYWNEGYRITNAVNDGHNWAVVMSEDSVYVDQDIIVCATKELAPTIEKCWTNKHAVSILTSYKQDTWLIITDGSHPNGLQAYDVEYSYDAIKQRIYERWNDGFTLKILEKSDNTYVAISTKYEHAPVAVQSFYVNTKLDGDYIKEQWDKHRDIAYFGSGKTFDIPESPTSYSQANSNNTGSQPGYCYLLPPEGGSFNLLASDKGNYCAIARMNITGPHQEELFHFQHNGIMTTSWSPWYQSGNVFALTETTDDYYVLKKYFYKQNASPYDLFDGWTALGDCLRVSRTDGSITNQRGERFYIPINDEQKKAIDAYILSLTQMAEGNYVPPVNSNNGPRQPSRTGSGKSKCNSCNGTGVCSSCKGKGGYVDYYGYSADKVWRNCPSCNGSGRCFNCYGKGHI